jgi:hypothetical protein
VPRFTASVSTQWVPVIALAIAALVLAANPLPTVYAHPARIQGFAPGASPAAAGHRAVGGSGILSSVACSSASSCWTVGQGVCNESIHWNGLSWSHIYMPTQGTTGCGSDYPAAVACTAKVTCWVASSSDDYGRNVTMRWSGTKWLAVPTPQPGGRHNPASLYGMACPSASDCWAVGQSGLDCRQDGCPLPGYRGLSNEALHWNGVRWSVVTVPQPGPTRQSGGGSLSGEGGVAGRGLESITCPSARDCWAVGAKLSESGSEMNEVLHWNGTKWTKTSAPQPVIGQLFSVACASANRCWAVGERGYSRNGYRWNNQVIGWDGRHWAAVTTPVVGKNTWPSLEGVACATPHDCWAVGTTAVSGVHTFNEILHWNGAVWSRSESPRPPHDADSLSAVTCASSSECWAVGQWGRLMGNLLNEVLRWNGSRWSLD